MRAVRHENAAEVEELLTDGADANFRQIEIPPGANWLRVQWYMIAGGRGLPHSPTPLCVLLEISPLDGPQRTENVKLVRSLLSHHADPNAQDRDGFPALDLATYWHFKETISALVHAGADVNAQDENGWTALYAAIRYDMDDVVELLLKLGADPNLAADDGTTPLQEAGWNKTANAHRIRQLLKRAGGL